MDLYMSGQISAYYYPGIRDGLFNISRFIAPGLAAISSSNLKNSVEDNLNIYIKDKHAIKALEDEFEAHLAQCQPLMDHYDILSYSSYWDMLLDQCQSENDIYSFTDSLSLLNFPWEFLDQGGDGMNTLQANLVMSLNERTFYEIIPLSILDPGNDSLPNTYKPGFIHIEDKDYGKDFLLKQLENQARLLEEKENYRLYLSKATRHFTNMQLIKNHSLLVTPKTDTVLALAIKEIRIINSIQSFIDHYLENNCITQRDQVLGLLRQKIQELKD